MGGGGYAYNSFGSLPPLPLLPSSPLIYTSQLEAGMGEEERE